MCREDCGGVTDTVFDLSLGEVLDVPQARPTEVRVHEYGAVKIRIIKDCVAQISSLEVSTVQAGIDEVSPGKIPSFKAGPR